MSKMKSMVSMYALAAMAMGGGFGGNSRERYTEPKETPEEKLKRLEAAKAKQNQSKGLKQFTYGDNIVWATNQNNADKKARKNNYIN